MLSELIWCAYYSSVFLISKIVEVSNLCLWPVSMFLFSHHLSTPVRMVFTYNSCNGCRCSFWRSPHDGVGTWKRKGRVYAGGSTVPAAVGDDSVKVYTRQIWRRRRQSLATGRRLGLLLRFHCLDFSVHLRLSAVYLLYYLFSLTLVSLLWLMLLAVGFLS